jgi:hypothetical protein
MTKWDTMLEALAREYHVGTEPPEVVQDGLQRGFPVRGTDDASEPVHAGQVAASPASSYAPLQTAPSRSLWVRDQIARAVDRIIDEAFAAYDRIAGSSNGQDGR